MSHEKSRDLILWLTAFAGPALWLFSFQAKFSWNSWTCASQTKLPLFLSALIAFVLTAAAGFLAWRQWNALGKEPPGEAEGALARSRFMALGAMVFSVGFCLVILAQTVPDIILGVCQ